MNTTNMINMKASVSSGRKLTVEGGYNYSVFAKDAIYGMLGKMNAAVRYHNTDIKGNIMVPHSLIFTYGLAQFTHCGLLAKGKRKFITRDQSKDYNIIREDQHKVKQSKTKYQLSTPALVEAFDRGLLDGHNADAIYKEIKIGGLMVLEKYTCPDLGIVNIYAKLEELYRPRDIVIQWHDSDNFNRQVQMKKLKFEQDKMRYIKEMSQPRIVDDSIPEDEDLAGIKLSLNELNLDEDIGNASKPLKRVNHSRREPISKGRTLRDILN